MMHAKPFAAESYVASPLSLKRLEPAVSATIAGQLAMMDPWRRLGYGTSALSSYLAGPDPNLNRFIVEEQGEHVGVVCIRVPWLRGPYLELLAVFPHAQGRGMGNRLLTWMEQEARHSASNLWTVTSEFNTRARRFYQAAGFVEVAPLPDLVTSGYNELLLRKSLVSS